MEPTQGQRRCNVLRSAQKCYSLFGNWHASNKKKPGGKVVRVNVISFFYLDWHHLARTRLSAPTETFIRCGRLKVRTAISKFIVCEQTSIYSHQARSVWWREPRRGDRWADQYLPHTATCGDLDVFCCFLLIAALSFSVEAVIKASEVVKSLTNRLQSVIVTFFFIGNYFYSFFIWF